MKPRILLTGATGFVGISLLKRLTGMDYEVTCLVRNKKKTNKLKNLNVKLIFGDITKKNSLENSVRGIDVVLHLAVLVSVSECIKNPVAAVQTNILGTLNLLEEIRKEASKSKREIFMIYLSSDKVYGNSRSKLVTENTNPNPLDTYSMSKLNSELMLNCYSLSYGNLSYIILRSANIYGYGQSTNFFIPSVISQILQGKNQIEVGNTNYFRNFVYIDDLVDAIILLLQKRNKNKNQVFNLSQSSVKASSILRLMKRLAATYLNREIKFFRSEKLIRPSSLESKKFRLDCSKIAKIGWKPKVKFDTGLRKTFLAFSNENG